MSDTTFVSAPSALTDYPSVDWGTPGTYPHATIPGRALTIEHVPDDDSRPDTLEQLARDQGWETCTPAEQAAYAKQEQDRIDAWQRGEWEYLGVVVVVIHEIKSTGAHVRAFGSCWGIESDCGDYVAEIARDCYSEAQHDFDELVAVLSVAVKGQ